MKPDEIDGMSIETHWWNFGKKTLDFRGTYKQFMENKGIRIERCKHPSQKDVNGWKASVSLSSTIITIVSYQDYRYACDDIIKTYLLLMGDKATLRTPFGYFKINWG